MDEGRSERRNGWRAALLGVCGGLAVNLAAGFFWSGRIDARVDSMETRLADNKSGMKALAQLPERLARVEARLDFVLQSLQRLEMLAARRREGEGP